MSAAVSLPAADYVIAGGGTAGLVLAARLSEIPSVNVAVIEAGGDRSHDINVLCPGLLLTLYGNPEYDWIYNSTPQEHMNGAVISYPRGKQLGGSSAINYLAWTHASPRNIDNWGLLGNPSWSWEELAPYYRKSENFSVPNAAVVSELDLHWLNYSDHGQSGPIRNAYPHEWTTIDAAWGHTYDHLGLGMVADERDGLALGGYDILNSLNLDNNTRSYAATSYLNPIRYRPNLKVYTNSLVTKINFQKGNGKPTASGVTFEKDGGVFTMDAKREIIVSSGAFNSPQLLELSGIGNADLLKSLGIELIYDNPHVGENLQDHLLYNLGWPVIPEVFTLDNLSDTATYDADLAEYKANRTGPLSWVSLGGGYLSAKQIIPDPDQLESFLANISFSVFEHPRSHPGYSQQDELMLKDLYNGQEVTQHLNIVGSVNPLVQDAADTAVPPPHSHGFTIQVCSEHMFSRGSVHIHSSNASIYPLVNPNFFSHPADAYMFARMVLQVQNVIAQTPPLSDYLVGNGTMLQPPYTNLTEKNAEDVIRRQAQTVSHPSGTCAMLPREHGGVVDERFRVYGVKRLRVVDASVFPLVPRGNLQTCVYAVAERAADFVKEDGMLI